MKQKFLWHSFLAGVLVTVLTLGIVGTAVATVGKQTVAVDYSNIKVTLNGQAVDLVDANGTPVEPFAINGTTYLPVRAVASTLGLDVGWDPLTSTVILSSSKQVEARNDLIMDACGVQVYFTGFSAPESEYKKGYYINLKIVNSGEKECAVQQRNLSVNGIMADGIFSSSVMPGKTAVDKIWVYNTEEKGITLPVTSAEFNLHLFDPKTFDTMYDSDLIKVE